MSDGNQSPNPAGEERYPAQGCVTLLLRLWIIENIVGIIILLFVDKWEDLWFIRDFYPDIEYIFIVPLLIIGLLNILFTTALLARKMWGFTGLWVAGLASVAVSIAAGAKFVHAFAGFTGLVTLYWLLQIGGDKSGWSRLR